MRILLVDDDNMVRNAFQRCLRARGYTVTTATDGQDALNHLAGAKFDIVVSDFEMPFVNGDTLCREVKNTYRLPFILLSGNPSVLGRGPEVGADVSRTKPISNADLVSEIEGLIGKPTALVAP
jgi:CheY-like chemotaxis protein